MSTKSAGEFSTWLEQANVIIRDKLESDVPCDECTACCHSSYFIHITPTDDDALKHIPAELVFSAPGLPKGHYLLGYDENGRCPMFVDNKCSIYHFRPQTCRQYDCRVFPATGIQLSEEGKELISKQSQRWNFEFPDAKDHTAFQAVQDSAKFLNDYARFFPSDFIPSNNTQKAVLAIAMYKIFINYNIEDDKDIHKYVKLIVASIPEKQS